jgi:hypothetical protein
VKGRLVVLALLVLGTLSVLWLRNGRERGAPRASEPPAERGEGAEAAAEPASAERASAEAVQREALAAGAGAVRALELELVRFPDEAPLVQVAVETVPPIVAPVAGGLATSDDGRVALALPAGTVALEVRVPGYEPGSLALEPAARAQRLALVPSSGLFGRVVRADGSAAAGAAVAVLVEERRLYYAAHATRLRPQAPITLRQSTAATAVANERGFYFLRFATRSERASVDVRASTSEGNVGQRRVELPREPAALEDLVLGEPERLRVRVVDLTGAPVAGAVLRGPDGAYPGATDAQGELALPAPRLPAQLVVRAEGLWLREQRHDGVDVGVRAKVESCATRVELVLGPAPGAKLRIVDAESGLPVFIGYGSLELLEAGEVVVQSSFEPDKRGLAELRFFDLARGPLAELPELAKVVFEKEGYLDGRLEFDPRLASPDEVLLLALEPDPAFACLRGRVERAGEPVPGLQVGLRAQARSEGAQPSTWQYARAYSDDEGRFSLRWRADPGLVVTVFPHWVKFDEFGFLGPMDGERAAQGEHVLDLEPAVRVPAILRGVAPEGSYCYYVRVLDEEGGSAAEVSTTINGAPLALAGSGDVRTSLLLPRHRRVRVTIGFLTATRVIENRSTPAEHDPAHPVLPLVFELQPVFARLQGRVVGVAPDELARIGVGFLQVGDQEARLARPASDGSFEFTRLPLGKGELYLVRELDVGSEVLARLELDLTDDREGLVLGPDPASLPEQTPER